MSSNLSVKTSTKMSSFFLIFGGLWLVLGLPFLLIGISTFKKNMRYDSEGVNVTGTVLSKSVEERWDSDRKHKSKSYNVKYKFLGPAGNEIESSGGVGSSEYESLTTGAPIELQYLKSEPQVNRLAENSDNVMAFGFMGFGGLSTIGGALILFYNFRSRSRRKRLLRDGAVAEAVITAVEQSNLTINNVRQWRLRYSYKDRMGKSFTGVSDYMSPQIAQDWHSGDKGQVKFDKTDPSQNLWLGRSGGAGASEMK